MGHSAVSTSQNIYLQATQSHRDQVLRNVCRPLPRPPNKSPPPSKKTTPTITTILKERRHSRTKKISLPQIAAHLSRWPGTHRSVTERASKKATPRPFPRNPQGSAPRTPQNLTPTTLMLIMISSNKGCRSRSTSARNRNKITVNLGQAQRKCTI